MQLRSWMLPLVFLCLAVLLLAAPAIAQQGAAPVVVTPNFAKAVASPNNPSCAKSVVVDGNPKTGPHVVAVRYAPGCRFPWHWHSADERFMGVNGALRLEMKGGKPEVLRSGAFAFMPAHHIHRSACPTGCEFFVSRSAAVDFHFVDPDGNEISFEQAMAALKEPAAKKARAKAK